MLTETLEWLGMRYLRVSCVVRRHDWKRAVRFLGNTGTQQCRRCGAKRDVTLKPRRALAAKGGAGV